MNSNRNKRKVALASAIIAASSITSQAAVTATSVFDGTNSVISLSFTEGVYTTGPADDKSSLLSWSGAALSAPNYSQITTAAVNTLISSSPLNFTSASYQTANGKGFFELKFDDFFNSQTISGGSLTFTLAGNAPAGSFPLSAGSFSGLSSNLTVVPEPGGTALVLLGSIGFLARRKR